MSHGEEKHPDPSLLDETLDEHAGCMQVVSELEKCLNPSPDDPRCWLADLDRRLADLETALRRHFEGEESGPLFRSLPLQHPRLAEPLARLEAEHTMMLDDLAVVQRRVETLEDPQDFELRELNARVLLVVARIRRHEAAENELVIEAYWSEIGVGD